MADLQTINIGNRVNDGLGDDLRTAFEKVNANFTDLNGELTITASNVGTTGVGVFKQKNGTDLEFKNLVGGTKILLDEQENSIVVNSTAPDAFERIDTNGGTVLASSFTEITLQGGDDIDVTALGSVITVDNIIPVTHILTYYDFGFLNGDYTNSVQVALQAANVEFGTLTYPGRLDIDCGPLV